MNDFVDPSADQILVERVQCGDREAFDLLVMKYQRRIFRLILRFVHEPALAEDVAQETFLRAYRAIGQFRGESQFYTWLYRIAVNTAKKAASDGAKDSSIHDSSIFSEDGETFSLDEQLSDMETPEALLAGRQIANTVNAAIDDLPEDLRTAIALREIEGMSYEDIALTMQCPVGTVRSRIFRAREAIAKKLRPLLGDKTGGRW